ncbi:hypothetical protein BG55_11520 [Erwinia mallotivora]|uniref:Uncharacterized protein n=1 Tax=Erwinia mallotivora TaxID=69222 RepID=A0A014N7L1_9GAMM|nr:hypothetical protein BG55_11520 [Erwinia mallotivora]
MDVAIKMEILPLSNILMFADLQEAYLWLILRRYKPDKIKLNLKLRKRILNIFSLTYQKNAQYAHQHFFFQG